MKNYSNFIRASERSDRALSNEYIFLHFRVTKLLFLSKHLLVHFQVQWHVTCLSVYLLHLYIQWSFPFIYSFFFFHFHIPKLFLSILLLVCHILSVYRTCMLGYTCMYQQNSVKAPGGGGELPPCPCPWLRWLWHKKCYEKDCIITEHNLNICSR